MEIYLVRHTTPDIEKGVCYGQADIGVLSSFETEANQVVRKIPKEENVVVISSPLKRCTKLAAEFSEKYTTDERLMELDFGKWELKNWNDIPKKEITPWMEDFVNVQVPNGESYLDLFARVLEFYKEIILNKTDQLILVTHGGVIRSLLAYLTKTDLKDSFDIKVTYGQVSKIVLNEKVTIEASL